jgi:hypothetical protein
VILRALTLIGGLAGATVSSQFPEFSQQYLQRLGGAVDALGEVVADFDASASRAGLSREDALDQLEGTAFLDARRADMTATFHRYERLSADLMVLQGQGPVMRALHVPRLTDGQIVQATWGVYEPAVPLTWTGAFFAIAGFISGAFCVGVILRIFLWPFRLAWTKAA